MKIGMILAMLTLISAQVHAEEQPGSKLTAIANTNESELTPELFERLASEIEGKEGSAIRILGEVFTQCLFKGAPNVCNFKPSRTYEDWTDLITAVQDSAERNNPSAIGQHFGCAYHFLRDSTEGEYLDCLKQGQLEHLNSLEE